jgi:Reverse transcriptase (RNA-dependent DNA polymerase)
MSYNLTHTDQVNLTSTSDPGEPKTMKEALIGPDKDKWIEAIKKEITNFMPREVWKPVSRKKVAEEMKRKLISTKWIFKKKTEQDNTIRHNARVVSRDFMQIPGVDYTESFAPV